MGAAKNSQNIYPGIGFEPLSADTPEHVQRYFDLIQSARGDAAIKRGLPEIFDTDATPELVGQKLRDRRRYMLTFDTLEGRRDVGRIELTEHLNDEPSVQDKVSAGVKLGMNACYFVVESLLARQGLDTAAIDRVHMAAADLTIGLAFELQEDKSASPWLPVAPEGDPSRGWILLKDREDLPYTISIDPAMKGWFPDFGIGEEDFSLALAEQK